VLVFEHATNLQRSGRGIDLRGDVVDDTLVRVTLLDLQPDLDRYTGDVAQGLSRSGERLLDLQYDGLAALEMAVDRRDWHDACKFSWTGVTDQGTHADQMARGNPVKRRRYLGVPEIDCRDVKTGLRVQHLGGRFGKLGLGIVDTRLRGKLLLSQG